MRLFIFTETWVNTGDQEDHFIRETDNVYVINNIDPEALDLSLNAALHALERFDLLEHVKMVDWILDKDNSLTYNAQELMV
jgi:hypothetical protein